MAETPTMTVIKLSDLQRCAGLINARVARGESFVVRDGRTGLVAFSIIPGMPREATEVKFVDFQGEATGRPLVLAGSHGHA